MKRLVVALAALAMLAPMPAQAAQVGHRYTLLGKACQKFYNPAGNKGIKVCASLRENNGNESVRMDWLEVLGDVYLIEWERAELRRFDTGKTLAYWDFGVTSHWFVYDHWDSRWAGPSYECLYHGDTRAYIKFRVEWKDGGTVNQFTKLSTVVHYPC